MSKRLQPGIRLGLRGRVIGSGTVTQVPAHGIARQTQVASNLLDAPTLVTKTTDSDPCLH